MQRACVLLITKTVFGWWYLTQFELRPHTNRLRWLPPCAHRRWLCQYFSAALRKSRGVISKYLSYICFEFISKWTFFCHCSLSRDPRKGHRLQRRTHNGFRRSKQWRSSTNNAPDNQSGKLHSLSRMPWGKKYPVGIEADVVFIQRVSSRTSWLR